MNIIMLVENSLSLRSLKTRSILSFAVWKHIKPLGCRPTSILKNGGAEISTLCGHFSYILTVSDK